MYKLPTQQFFFSKDYSVLKNNLWFTGTWQENRKNSYLVLKVLNFQNLELTFTGFENANVGIELNRITEAQSVSVFFCNDFRY